MLHSVSPELASLSQVNSVFFLFFFCRANVTFSLAVYIVATQTYSIVQGNNIAFMKKLLYKLYLYYENIFTHRNCQKTLSQLMPVHAQQLSELCRGTSANESLI